MRYSILYSSFVAYVIFCYSQIHCKKNKEKKSVKMQTKQEYAYDSHMSAIISKEWIDNRFLNVSPDNSKHLVVDVLKKYLENDTFFLELASGNGERVMLFAQNFPYVTFQPTDYECDPNPTSSGIPSYQVRYNSSNILEPMRVDVRSPSREWSDGVIQEESVHYMFLANLVYAAPLTLTTGIFEGAARYLKAGGFFFMYGPFKLQGKIYGDDNVKLDRELRKKNYLWGLREVWGELNEEAFDVGLYLEMLYKLPDHNQILAWKKDEVMQYHLDESKISVERAFAETPYYADDDYADVPENKSSTYALPTFAD